MSKSHINYDSISPMSNVTHEIPKRNPKKKQLRMSLQQVAWSTPNHGAHIKNPRWVLAKNELIQQLWNLRTCKLHYFSLWSISGTLVPSPFTLCQCLISGVKWGILHSHNRWEPFQNLLKIWRNCRVVIRINFHISNKASMTMQKHEQHKGKWSSSYVLAPLGANIYIYSY